MAKAKVVALKQMARFVINKDNTVTDQKTGLLIIQNPTLLGEVFKKTMTFAEAVKAIADLNAKGYAKFKDWRLPTVEELCAMVSRIKSNPCYDTNIFKGKFDYGYWSNETCVWNNKDAAWCVYSNSGYVSYYVKSYHGYVWPVRSSQCPFDSLSAR